MQLSQTSQLKQESSALGAASVALQVQWRTASGACGLAISKSMCPGLPETDFGRCWCGPPLPTFPFPLSLGHRILYPFCVFLCNRVTSQSTIAHIASCLDLFCCSSNHPILDSQIGAPKRRIPVSGKRCIGACCVRAGLCALGRDCVFCVCGFVCRCLRMP